MPISSHGSLERETTLRLCEKIDSARSLSVAILVRYEAWSDYLDLVIDPSIYECPRRFAEDYLVTSILTKSKFLSLDSDPSHCALASFAECETRCSEASDRWFDDEHPSWVPRFRKIISRVLGPLDGPALDKIAEMCRHGPGAAVGVKGLGAVLSDKYDKVPTVTEELAPFARSLMGESWSEYRPLLQVVRGARFFTVPKNAKTDRCCATEPLVNQWLQQGIGRYMADRLRLFGVDISDQTVNQQWASVAEQVGLATLDLSSASDSISHGLIFTNLPPRWRALLSLARSRQIEMPDGQWLALEKFCTMGNGFTFALETLIFWSLCRAVCEDGDVVSAYGDDLIVPQARVEAVVAALEFSGFRVNMKKSALAGHFFESCGTDWFKGQPVRPFYLRSDPRVDDDDIMSSPVPYPLKIANALILWAHRLGGDFGLDGKFHGVWDWLVKQVPDPWNRCRVPPHAGDVGVICSPSSDSTFWHMDYQGTWFKYKRILMDTVDVDKGTFGVELAWLAGTMTRNKAQEFLQAPIRGWRDLAELALAFRSSEGKSGLATRGVEPQRGLYGRIRTEWATTPSWPDGLSWLHCS